MIFHKPARDPIAAINAVALPHQQPQRKMHRPGFNDFLGLIPKIDPSKLLEDVQEELYTTSAVLATISDRVRANIESLDIPQIADGDFGRIILAIEEPKIIDGEAHPGAEIILALWGKGFSSPVHGHAPGFIYEELLSGSFEVRLFNTVGDPQDRLVAFDRHFTQNKSGVFYSDYKQYIGQEPRSELIHNFYTNEFAMSLHFLPEHVRDGNRNRHKVVNTTNFDNHPDCIKNNIVPYRIGFETNQSDWIPVTMPEFMATYQVGDIYAIRSHNVSYLGDHYAMITTSYCIEKPYGFRPDNLFIPIPHGEPSPLDFSDDFFLARRLRADVAERFRKFYNL